MNLTQYRTDTVQRRTCIYVSVMLWLVHDIAALVDAKGAPRCALQSSSDDHNAGRCPRGSGMHAAIHGLNDALMAVQTSMATKSKC